MMFTNRFFWPVYGALVLMLASCADGGKYVNALPEDAAAVVAVNLEQMAGKSGADKSTVEAAVGALKSEMRDAEGLIDRIVEDPSESGLELTDKVYFFASPQGGTIGMLARVSSGSKMDRLMEVLQEQRICESLVESDGCTWTVVGGTALAAYTDEAFLLLADTDGGDPKDLQHRASMWLRQKEEGGFAAQFGFGKVKDSAKDVAALVSLALMPRQYMAPLTMGVSADLRLEDVRSFLTLNFEEGMVVLESELMTTDKLTERIWKMQMEATGEVKGNYMDLFPANTGLWMTGNVDGGKLYSLLCENPTIRRQFENSMMPIDFQMIFNSMKGDMVFAMPEPQRSAAFIAYADVTNHDFLRTFEDLKPLLALTGGTMRLVNLSQEEYEFRISDASMMGLGAGAASFWFGVRNGHFYLTNDRSLVDCRVPGLTLRNCEWSGEVKGKRYFVSLNLRMMGEESGMWTSVQGMSPVFFVLRLSDYLVIKSDDGKTVRMEWKMRNREENALKQLVENN